MDCMQGGIGDLHYRQQEQLLINSALSIMAMHNYINTVSMQLPQRPHAGSCHRGHMQAVVTEGMQAVVTEGTCMCTNIPKFQSELGSWLGIVPRNASFSQSDTGLTVHWKAS